MAKLHATEAAQHVIDAAVQIFGGLGVAAATSAELLYREVRALRIYEGASEVQKLIIARHLLGENEADPMAHDLMMTVSAHAALRARHPLVQCLTNSVSTNFVANALLAAGAAPAMVDNPEEAEMFAGIADAVLVNLGTPTQAQSLDAGSPPARRSFRQTLVLDPIGAGGLPWRGGVAVEYCNSSRPRSAAMRPRSSASPASAAAARASTVPPIRRTPSAPRWTCWRTPRPCRPPVPSIIWLGGSPGGRCWCASPAATRCCSA